MIHKWMEEWHDTMLFLTAIPGLLIFFLIYWNGEYQNRYAELVIQDFLLDATVKGEITLEGYEAMVRSLDAISSDYNQEISCVVYEPEPVYALIQEEELKRFYMNRNVKKEKVFEQYTPVSEEEKPEFLCLQKESNEELIASVQNKLPLPKDNVVSVIEALNPVQWVYEGEKLVTLCHVVSEEGEYYIEANAVKAENSGSVDLTVQIGNMEYKVPVQVYCYPRVVVCENGHEVVNSENILAFNESISRLICPFCAIIPEKISCGTELIHITTGRTLTKEDIWISVVYMNGTTEIVTPDSAGWQDSYDENYCGIQEVTVSYRGAEDTFFAASENAGCRQCNGACNERNYDDYVSFPYCTECLSERELFTGKVYEGERIFSSAEIVTRLDNDGKISLKSGDYIRIYLTKKKRYVSMLQGKIKQDGSIEEEK